MGAIGKLEHASLIRREAYLGVTASVRGLVWRDRVDATAAKHAAAISQRHGLPELLGRVLASRQIMLDEVTTALNPTIRALMPDPSLLRDMDKGAARLADAIEQRQAIAVFGDYDVDGACGAAVLQRFLAAHGCAARIYIPDRLTEGYGPNRAAIANLAEAGARLIVTVDCGTAGIEPLSAARTHGADVIVVDHHQADEQLPDVVAVINPNRQDDLSGLGHLCATGVAFMLLVATARELRRRGHAGAAAPNLLELLDLVALATVCDVVPLKGLNRAYVAKGLEVMRHRRNAGLRALADAAGLAVAPTPYHLGFVLGPRINAGGRVGDSGLGARLLATEDALEATRIALTLDKLNRERKLIEAQMLEEAMARAELLIASDPERPLLLMAGQGWHQGVVGLVASRLVERFQRPACAIAWDDPGDGTGTGSLRSIAGVDIGAVVRAAAAAGLLERGGGHAMAAGLKLRRDRLEAVEAYMLDQLARPAATARAALALEIDGALTALTVSDELADLLERAGPYGHGNPLPRFAFPAHRVAFAKIVGGAHVRCALQAGDGSRLDAVAFRAAGQPLGAALLSASGLPLHVAGHLRRDTWGGRCRCELVVEDVADPRAQG